MSKNDALKLQLKRQLFTERVERLYPGFDFSCLSGKPRLAIRVNTLKSSRSYHAPIEWAPDCFWAEAEIGPRSLTAIPEATSGEVYLQNASSFIPPIVLAPQPGEAILDMCAAPGGKASFIAALTSNAADLWVNDNSKPRFLRMRQNFQRLGVRTVSETLYSLQRLPKALPDKKFNKILLDAPCSGEGLLDYTQDQSFKVWSMAHIKRLQQLQKQGLRAGWSMLQPGGSLVYATCTMAPEENEAVIDWFLSKHVDAKLELINLPIGQRVDALQKWNGRCFANDLSGCLRIKPDVAMESFFVAKLTRNAA